NRAAQEVTSKLRGGAGAKPTKTETTTATVRTPRRMETERLWRVWWRVWGVVVLVPVVVGVGAWLAARECGGT
ncbi:hypothetical protein HK104_006890, partial [Borealophlyctis nickersoniae]